MRKRKCHRKITTYETAVRPDQHRWAGPILNSLGAGIYAVRTADGLIKIGQTSHLGNRIRSYGTGRELLAIRLGATFADEQAIHESLAGHSVRGREWYAPAQPVLDVVNAMRADLGQEPIPA